MFLELEKIDFSLQRRNLGLSPVHEPNVRSIKVFSSGCREFGVLRELPATLQLPVKQHQFEKVRDRLGFHSQMNTNDKHSGCLRFPS
jgi:hypothetical protein